MALDSLYICSRCRKKFDINGIRYDSKRKIVCLSCLGKTESEDIKKIRERDDPLILSFICIRCRFKFRVKKGSQKKISCPYCGRLELMQVKKYKDEDDLIKDSSNSKYDY